MKRTLIAIMLIITALITSCDFAALFGLDTEPGKTEEPTTTPTETEIIEGYFYSSGDRAEYSLEGAEELRIDEDILIALDSNRNQMKSIELSNGNEYSAGRRETVTVTMAEGESITLTKDDTEPLIYSYSQKEA